MIAMLVDRESTVSIESQPVRSGLTILSNVSTGITTGRAKHVELAFTCGRVLVDSVGVWITKQKIATILVHPDRPFGKLETFPQFENLRIRPDNFIHAR